MVYGGKPSRGCYTCRKRKIKCDEGTPECSRCLRIGKQCSGYRNPTDFVFRSENQNAKFNVLKRHQAQELFLQDDGYPTNSEEPSLYKSETEDVSFFPLMDGMSRSVSPYQPPCVLSFFPNLDILPVIDSPLFHNPNGSAARSSDILAYGRASMALNSTPALAPDLDHQALCHFFHRYVVPPQEGVESSGWLDFLVNLYQESSELSALRKAVMAVSLAHLANQSDDEWLGLKARQAYGDALHAVNFALRDPKQQLEDGTLTAVYLLIFFDSVKGTEKVISSTHGAGLNTLLQLRGGRQFTTQRGRSLHRTVCGHLLGRTLAFRTHPPPDLVKWLASREKDGTVNLAHEMLWISQICASITDLLPSRARYDSCRERERSTQLLNLLQEAEEVNAILDRQYSADVTPMWRFRDITQPKDSHAPTLPRPRTSYQPMHLYSNINTATRWNSIRTARIVLHQTILECFSYLGTFHAITNHTPQSWALFQSATYEKSTRTIDAMVADIIASVPYVIGEVDSQGRPLPQLAGKVPGGIPLQWALWTSFSCPFASRERNIQARMAMERLGSVLGFRKAMFLARSGGSGIGGDS